MNQSGGVLFISLLCLILLALIGLATMETSTLEEQSARQIRDRQLAFEAAESALQDAEKTLLRFVRGWADAGAVSNEKRCVISECSDARSLNPYSVSESQWVEIYRFDREVDVEEVTEPPQLDANPQGTDGVRVFQIDALRGHFAGMPDASYLYRMTGYGYDSSVNAGDREALTVRLQETYRPVP